MQYELARRLNLPAYSESTYASHACGSDTGFYQTRQVLAIRRAKLLSIVRSLCCTSCSPCLSLVITRCSINMSSLTQSVRLNRPCLPRSSRRSHAPFRCSCKAAQHAERQETPLSRRAALACLSALCTLQATAGVVSIQQDH